jgi:cell division protein FtsL
MSKKQDILFKNFFLQAYSLTLTTYKNRVLAVNDNSYSNSNNKKAEWNQQFVNLANKKN